MSKSKDKQESRKRSVNSSLVKRPKSQNEGIEMSKQLLAKRAKSTRTGQTRVTSCNNKSNEARMCGNGKPMPSLSELEKMFEDSDDESVPRGSQVTTNKCEILPETTPELGNPLPLSPESIKLISNKVLNLISNIPNETISLEDETPPAPVIPIKKYKNSDVPYIVGCKDRPQVIKKHTKVNFSGDKDYGVNSKTNDFDQENECTKKRKRTGEPLNLSKSLFNAKSDEIAQVLKTIDDDCDSVESTDSNKTVPYDFNKSPSRNRSFSPLPSTSRDNVTILKNDQKFNESYVDNSEVLDSSIKSQVILDEIILLDDDKPDNANNKQIKSPVNLYSDSEDMYSSVDFEIKYNSEISEVIDVDDILAENRSIIAKHRNKTNLDKIILVDNVMKSEPKDSDNIALPDGEALNQNNQVNEQNFYAEQIETKLTEESNTPKEKNNASVSNTSLIMGEIVTNFFRNNSLHENKKDKYPIPIIDLSDVGTTLERTMTAITRNIPKTLLQNVPTIDLVDCDTTPQQVYTLSDSVISISSPSYVESTSPEPLISFFDPISGNNWYQHSSTPLCNASSRQRGRQQRGVNRRQPQTSGRANALNALIHIIGNPNTTSPKAKKCKRTNAIAQKTNNCAANTNSQLSSQPSPDISSKTPANTNPNAPGNTLDSLRRTLGDCPICMEDLNKGSIASTICGHLFCMNCIKVSLKENGKRCPNCRKTLKGVGYHQIFI